MVQFAVNAKYMNCPADQFRSANIEGGYNWSRIVALRQSLAL